MSTTIFEGIKLNKRLEEHVTVKNFVPLEYDEICQPKFLVVFGLKLAILRLKA